MLFCRRLLLSPIRRRPLRILTTHHARLTTLSSNKLTPERVLEDYTTQRSQHHPPSTPFTSDTFHTLWNLALVQKRYVTLQHLAQDVVHTFNGPLNEQAKLVCTVLNDVSKARIPRQDVSSLLEKLDDVGELDSLSLRTLQTLALLPDTHPHKDDGAVLRLIVPTIVSHLQRLVAPAGAAGLSYRPRPFVKACFRLARRLVSLKDQQTALGLFQVLVGTRHIPQHVVSGANASHKDFAFLIRSTLVRAALHWDWHDVAGDVLRDMVRVDGIHPEVVSGILDGLYGLLESPVASDVDTCSDVLRALPLSTEHVADGLIRQFYASAHQFDMGDAAQAFYAFTLRQEEEGSGAVYPLPPGSSLTWLLNHLTVRRRNDHLGRRLVHQVAQGETSIPVHDRARFIQLASRNSYGAAARVLYERYSVGKDRDGVRGDGRVAVRLVSLFWKLIKQTEGKLEEMVGAEHPDVQDPRRELLHDRLDDFKRFVDHVLTEFQQVHTPLDRADHYSLTSLARCYVIVGRFKEALEVLRWVMERHELPDVHDINVALSALAEYNPNTAMQLVEHMHQKGIRPSSVTFGTVVHQGIVHGQPKVVQRAIELARTYGEKISSKTVMSLIRASVSGDLKTGQVKENLVRALRILESAQTEEEKGVDVGGKYLVYASLRAHEPEMAFQFWTRLVRDGGEWADGEQAFLRRLIAQMIRKHVRLGWMSAEVGRMRVYELGEQRRRLP